jgi:SAM-dependent methyltransferase
VTERFDAGWLALREPFDHAARNVALAQRLADRLPRRPRLLDLGAGTGSLFRFLAPIIGRGQDWLLVDSDAGLLDEAFGRTAAWARRQGFAATAPNDALLVSTPHGLWRMQAVQRDLATAPSIPPSVPPSVPSSWPGLTRPSTTLNGASGKGRDARVKPGHDERLAFEADAVLCSALLDLVSPAWLMRLLDTLHVPFFASLTVDGRDVWQPHHPCDPLVFSAFRRDQRRDKGLGHALGIAAPAVALRALTARAFATASAPTDWRVPRTALRMQRALIDGAADAARDADPARARAITDWQEARLRQAMRGRLAIRIGHRDILAWPP